MNEHVGKTVTKLGLHQNYTQAKTGQKLDFARTKPGLQHD